MLPQLDTIQTPPKISLANLPSPLRRLDTLSNRTGKNIWLKCDDQTGFVLGGNKVRKLEYLLAAAKEKGSGVVITCGGVQSNHCRATAYACAQLGLKCHLILRNDLGYRMTPSVGQANHFLDQLAGASFELHDPKTYTALLDTLFKEAEQRFIVQGLIPYAIPTGGSNGLGVWGYLKAFEEICQQCEQNSFTPEYIVCASGSGGTQAGLSLGAHLHSDLIKVLAFAVCDNAAYFDNKVRSDIRAWAECAGIENDEAASLSARVPVHTNDSYIGPGYARSYPELYACISTLAKSEGLVLDPTYTGKAFFGMLSELTSPLLSQAENIVFVHTGGGFGLFPHASEFTE